jgi:hypothetical protein
MKNNRCGVYLKDYNDVEAVVWADVCIWIKVVDMGEEPLHLILESTEEAKSVYEYLVGKCFTKEENRVSQAITNMVSNRCPTLPNNIEPLKPIKK